MAPFFCRAHLNCQPHLPAQSRQRWVDYLNLARTRLSDLGSLGDVKTAPIFGRPAAQVKLGSQVGLATVLVISSDPGLQYHHRL